MKRFISNTLLAIGLVFVLNSCSINDTESDDIRFEMEYYLSEIIVDGKHYERIEDVDNYDVDWVEKETGTRYDWYCDTRRGRNNHEVDANGFIYDYVYEKYLTDKNNNKLIDFKFRIGNISDYFIKYIIKNEYHKIQITFARNASNASFESLFHQPYCSSTISKKGDILTINYNEDDYDSDLIQYIKKECNLATLPNSYKFIRQGDLYKSTVNYKNSDGSERKVEFIYTATKPLRIIP